MSSPGRVVKGTNFVGLRDAGDPVELAERYDAEGADELVFLDITASHERRETIVELARRTADNVFIPFTIGGGIRSVADAQAVLDAGADKVSVNSSALARPELIGELAEVFGSQCVVVAIDAKRRPGTPPAWDVYVDGGRTRVDGREAVAWAREAVERGAGEMLLTSMDRDGTTDGYDLELTRAVADAVARPGDRLGRRRRARAPRRGRSTEGGADAVLCGSIFHYGTYTVAEAKRAMSEAGIAVREVSGRPPLIDRTIATLGGGESFNRCCVWSPRPRRRARHSRRGRRRHCAVVRPHAPPAPPAGAPCAPPAGGARARPFACARPWSRARRRGCPRLR